MASLASRARVAAAALALLCAAAVVAAQPPATEGDWTTGRATFFSAPAEFKQACARARARCAVGRLGLLISPPRSSR